MNVGIGESAPFHHGRGPVPVICRRSHKSHPFGVFYGENPLDYSFTLILLEMAMVILITRAVRYLLRPLKQPRVVSDMIGGIIIGPSILGRNKKFARFVFPENAVYVFRNIGIMGLMYFLFISGVKMDLATIQKAGRKQWLIALFGVLLPLGAVCAVSLLFWNYLDKDIAKPSSILAISSLLAITAFPVLYPILKELNLLSSEIGRLALSTAIISDVVGINIVVAFEAAKQGEVRSINALWYILSVIATLIFVMSGLRRAMAWIIRNTPAGKPVDQIYIVGILCAVLMMGFLTDFLGAAIANGPLWLGLAIPDGPPLGSTLVERSETFVTEVIMPFAFAYMGLYTDVFSMSGNWASLGPMFAMASVGLLTKLVTVFLCSLLFEMPVRDSLTLGFIMSLRGEVEILLFFHWVDYKILKKPGYAMMVLLILMVTAVATPMITLLYNPDRPYMVNKRRTIQHTPPNAELHIVACIHDQQTVVGLINLLDVSNPTLSSPCFVSALYLTELVGRAAPVFIDHEKQDPPSSHDKKIENALKRFQESRAEYVYIHSYTAVSPRRTMYQDICELALEQKATFIILPFHKELYDTRGGTQLLRRGVQSLNSKVLDHAPCSVGILVDKGHFRNPLAARSFRRSSHRFAVLFLGGADAREALIYADRMAGSPEISLTVVRFLSYNYMGDDEMEKKLDDGVVTWFWVKNEGNDRVVYREAVVRNGAETVAAIQAMNDNSYDLWILGRKQGINPVLIGGLLEWSENNELGVIGDYVASVDFGGTASVLVVQQQVLRGQENKSFSQQIFACGVC